MSDPGTELAGEIVATSRRLGRYELRYRVAQGGMASVFLGQLHGEQGFNKWLALKVVHPHIASDPGFVRMFVDEARLAARLQHPNLCTVFDFGEREGALFLAMEYLHGESLAVVGVSAWDEGAMPLELAARIVADAARGLHAAHELRREDGSLAEVVHRDISPQNIFVLYDGTTKVVDFGIARWNERVADTTGSGVLKGKLAYMAPEHLRNEAIDRRIDVWALGVVLWELVVGRRLFKRQTDPASLYAVLNDPIPAASALRREVPQALDAILTRALRRDRSLRYSTALELARALEAWLATRGSPFGVDEVADWMRARFAERIAYRDQLLRDTSTEAVREVPHWSDANLKVPRHKPPRSVPPDEGEAIPLLLERHAPLRDVVFELSEVKKQPAPAAAAAPPAPDEPTLPRPASRPPIPTSRRDRTFPMVLALVGVLLLVVVLLAVAPRR